jgi:predicted ribosome quality control (RQC) complex YloA/Tae2 family protein
MIEFHPGDNSFVRIGSNAADNWEIIETLKRSDIWIHLKDAPSCHAMVRIPKKLRDNDRSRMNILNRVAHIMCIQSAKRIPRNSDNVTFIYTNGKYVRKGFAPGEAILSVTPDEFSVENPQHM